MATEIKLRDYQLDAVNQVRSEFHQGKKAVCLEMPTGSGKTYTFCSITDMTYKRNLRVYIIVPKDNIFDQTHRSLTNLGIPHGLIGSGKTMINSLVQVCSAMTLVRRMKLIPYPDLIIVDECHHANAGTWKRIIEYYHKAYHLGVTATPCRSDGTGMGIKSGGFYEALVNGPSMQELQRRGALCGYEYYLPPAGVDLSQVKTGQGEYNQKDLDEALRKPKITGCAIDHYLRICPSAPAIAFCVSIAHAKEVAEQFKQRGITAMALTSELTIAQVRSAIKALGEGRIQVLTSCNIISEGTDIPVVTTAILLRPTHSLSLYLQQVGRVLRPCPGKDKAIILDHVNNIGRHGLPDAEREWKLDVKKKKTKKGVLIADEDGDAVPQTRECDSCFLVHRPQPTCPRCGNVYSNNRQIEQIDGSLKKLSSDEVERMKREKRAERGRLSSYEDVVEFGKQKGYKPSWAKIYARSRGMKIG